MCVEFTGNSRGFYLYIISSSGGTVRGVCVFRSGFAAALHLSHLYGVHHHARSAHPLPPETPQISQLLLLASDSEHVTAVSRMLAEFLLGFMLNTRSQDLCVQVFRTEL